MRKPLRTRPANTKKVQHMLRDSVCVPWQCIVRGMQRVSLKRCGSFNEAQTDPRHVPRGCRSHTPHRAPRQRHHPARIPGPPPQPPPCASSAPNRPPPPPPMHLGSIKSSRTQTCQKYAAIARVPHGDHVFGGHTKQCHEDYRVPSHGSQYCTVGRCTATLGNASCAPQVPQGKGNGLWGLLAPH